MAPPREIRALLQKALDTWENEGGAVDSEDRRPGHDFVDHLIHGSIVLPILTASAIAAHAALGALA